MAIKITVYLLDKTAKLPTKANPADAGWDLYSPIDILIPKLSSVVIDTKIAIEPHFNYMNLLIYGQLKGRSGLSINDSIEVCNAGVIDQDYRGPIKVKLYNKKNKDYQVKKGDRICQIIFNIIPKIEINLGNSDSLNTDTHRGIKGLGSSGK